MYDKVAKPLERRLRNKIYKLLIEQLKTIVVTVKRVLNETKANGMSEEDAIKKAEEVIKQLKLEEGVQTFMLALIPEWINAGKIGAELFEQIHIVNEEGILFGIIKEEYLEWLNTYGGNEITLINNTTKEMTKKIVKEGLIKGKKTEDIAMDLWNNIADYDKRRSRVIAETEIHNTIMNSNYMCALKNGFKFKKWISSRDKDVRPTHQDYDKKGSIAINKEFAPGLMFPGDTNAPACEVVKCRCTIKYELYEDD